MRSSSPTSAVAASCGDVSALGGLVLAAGLPAAVRADRRRSTAPTACRNGWVDNPLVFVAIAEDGIVSIACHRAEMGQGVRTGMPMIVADELEADWRRCASCRRPATRSATATRTPTARAARATSSMPMRRCGAAARARCWKQPRPRAGTCRRAKCEAMNHEVVHRPTGRKLGYGELAKAAAKLPVPARDAIAPQESGAVPLHRQGRAQARRRLRTSSTGKAQYGIDVRLPGMLYAVVARPPVYGGKVKSFDAAEALKVPGVVKVVEIDRAPPPPQFQPLGGVAVIANNTWAAMQGPRGAEDRLGRRPERDLRLGRLQGGAGGGRAQARQGGSRTTATSTPRMAKARAQASRRSTTSRTSRTRRWSRRPRRRASSTASARSGRRVQSPQAATRRRREAARLSARERDRERHAARRRLRPQVQARLRVEAALLSQGDGRQAGQGRLDARRRPAPRLLPHGLGRAPGSGARRAGASPIAWLHRSVAPSHHVARSTPIRSTRRRSSSAWGWSTCRSRFPTCASRTRRRPRTRASAGSARCRTSRTRSRCSPSSPSWPRPRGAIPKDYLLELIGPPRAHRSAHDAATPGITANRPSATRSTPGACAA